MDSSFNENIQKLSQALLKLRNADEIRIFLKDLLSNSELDTITQRFDIAMRQEQGLPYTEIERETGASSATIAKVSENLKYGNDGYKLIIDRLKKSKIR
jgi:TrpR-related protein YerC/YecD